jgi:hypothetical protein
MGIKGWLGGAGRLLWPALGVYYLVLALTWLGPDELARRAASALPALAGVVIALGLGATAWQRYRRDGLERQVLLEATCFGFFATIVAGVFLDAPWTYDVGVATWFLATAVRTRQLLAA